MGKRLIVAEKPAVGRDIANVLNCRENGEGCRIGSNDVVTWAVGHLVGLCYPDEMDAKYKEWRMNDLPIIPDAFRLKVLDSGQRQFEIVKMWMNDPEIDTIVCATDAGREGELIFRYIYQMAECSKPVERLWISSLTFRAIKEGFEKLRPSSEYDDLYESARCRSEADWLIGMNGSRAYAILNDIKRMSIGRVMSPTLAILVNREKEIRRFIPEEYCEVVANFDGFEGRLINSKGLSHFSITQRTELENYIKNHSKEGRVVSKEFEKEIQPSPLLYDLTSLQRDANRLFGMSSKWTLDTAQSLYERHKAITYPRTDSRFLTSDIKSTLPKRIESLMEGELAEYAQAALLSEKDLFGRFIYNKGVSDHHAIIPTGEAKGMDKWTKQERQIYDLISRRFLGIFLPDREVIHQKAIIDVDGKDFLSVGGKETISGWCVVDKSKKNSIQVLPEMEEKDIVSVSGMRIRSDKTKPPAPHTEASLLTAMEHAGNTITEDENELETEYGIGTPATRAATIEKIVEKGMAIRKGRALIPTEYGIKTIEALPEILQSPEMTGEWEYRLSKISKGKESAREFMEDIRDLTKDVVTFAEKKGNTDIKKSMSVGLCPICKNPVKEYESAYYCTNKECSFRKIYKAVKGLHPTLDSNTMMDLLANGTAKSLKGEFKLLAHEPYIGFEYAKKNPADYKGLRFLLEYYGIVPVNKVPNGGGFWVPGGRHEELILDFIKDCREINCEFAFVQDSKALGHKNGWCHRVDPKDRPAFDVVFEKRIEVKSEQSIKTNVKGNTENTEKEDLLELIKKSGFEYADKRTNGGALWIVAGEDEGKPIIEKCKQLGMTFAFTAKGGRASKHRPAWYSLK